MNEDYNKEPVYHYDSHITGQSAFQELGDGGPPDCNIESCPTCKRATTCIRRPDYIRVGATP